MPFDSKRAIEIANRDDRDTAPFFAGRKEEITAFDIAVKNAATKPQAVFRIYQGPPGCGKTSLAHHLAETRFDKALFVPCNPDDLTDAARLSDRIERAAIERGGAVARAFAIAAKTAGERLGARPLADAALRAVAGFTSGDATVVLHLDEAHARLLPAAKQLCNLHATGLGTPCVVVLTGLGHTRDELSAIKGLTRAAHDATHNIEALTDEECAKSTLLLFDEVCPEGSKDAAEALAKLTTQLAHRWPQHLNRAQKALCEELLRVDGKLCDVDPDRVRKRSDGMRHEYYEARLRDHPAFKINRALTQRVLVEINRKPPEALSDLDRLCGTIIDQAGLSESFSRRAIPPEVFADALVEKGLVTAVRCPLGVAIPSMVDWATNELPEFEGRKPSKQTPPHRVGTGR